MLHREIPKMVEVLWEDNIYGKKVHCNKTELGSSTQGQDGLCLLFLIQRESWLFLLVGWGSSSQTTPDWLIGKVAWKKGPKGH